MSYSYEYNEYDNDSNVLEVYDGLEDNAADLKFRSIQLNRNHFENNNPFEGKYYIHIYNDIYHI